MRPRIGPKTALTHLTLLGALLLTFAFPGCFPSNQAQNPAPFVDSLAESPEMASHRAQYNKNRMTPPRTYSVMPKQRRNNDFSEFDDSLQYGLDSQPELPPLPGDTAIMPAVGGPATYSMAAASYPRSGSGSMYPVTAAPAAGEAYHASQAPRPAGINTDATFYPIEQLVFGGDYPDIDKPEAYRLMPKDVIAVTVRDHPEFSGKLDIQPDGTIRIPNSPDLIRIRGLTVDEAADEIRRELQVYVKGDCVVRVQANRARGGYYFVFGDVTQPGRFPMGLEPVKLSDAVLAANWETNPNRMDEDDELSPAFPAASPRGKYQAPRSADMARVMLVTPHRSQPVRTTHDLRQAMLGITAEDPVVRPGQIIIVPSLDPEKNLSLGIDLPNNGVPPPGLMPGQGFSTGNSSYRLPEVTPPGSPYLQRQPRPISEVDANMAQAYGIQSNTEAHEIQPFPTMEEECDVPVGEYCPITQEIVVSKSVIVPSVDPAYPKGTIVVAETPVVMESSVEGVSTGKRGRQLKQAPVPSLGKNGNSAEEHSPKGITGFRKGF